MVKDLAVVREALEAVRKAARNIELAAVRGGQLEAFPPAEGRRIAAHIHQHVEDRAGGAADELDLRLRVGLEVHPANHAALAA